MTRSGIELTIYRIRGEHERVVSLGGAPGPMSLGGPNKQVESCFLNHSLSIHCCCTDSLLMTHHGGLSLSIIIWRIGRGWNKLHFALGLKNSLGVPDANHYPTDAIIVQKIHVCFIFTACTTSVQCITTIYLCMNMCTKDGLLTDILLIFSLI